MKLENLMSFYITVMRPVAQNAVIFGMMASLWEGHTVRIARDYPRKTKI